MRFDVERPIYSVSEALFPRDSRAETVSAIPVRAGDSWTMNMFVRADRMPQDRTNIAGFGQCDDSRDGAGRYLSVFASQIHFWSSRRDIDTNSRLSIDQWQMLTLTYDGVELRIYKNARMIGRGDIDLADDEPIVRLAPIDPWDKRRACQGEIRNLTIWTDPLSPGAITALQAAGK